MTTITVMMKLMIFVLAVTSIINCQHINTVSIRMSFVSTINARKKIINSRTAVRKTMIYIKKNLKKNKFDKSDKTFKTFMRHIILVKIFINNLMISHCDFYILNSETIHHCLNNKILFKNLRTIHEVIKTVNDEVLNIEIINNIEISFSNDEFLILSEVMYISILMMNLIVISRL